MNDAYSPHTGEHIKTDAHADWMRRAGVPAPEYNPQTHGCFWRGDAWEVVAAKPESTPVPQTISRAQGRLALHRAGLWPQVQAFVESITDQDAKFEADAALNHTTDWERSSPFLGLAAQALGLDDDQIDNLFRTAAGITP